MSGLEELVVAAESEPGTAAPPMSRPVGATISTPSCDGGSPSPI